MLPIEDRERLTEIYDRLLQLYMQRRDVTDDGEAPMRQATILLQVELEALKVFDVLQPEAEQPEETEQAEQSAPLGQAVQAEQPPEVDHADQPDRAEQRERSRLEILQAVERKEITIEEAMALLRELEETA